MKKIYNIKIEVDTDKINYIVKNIDILQDTLRYLLEEVLPYHFTLLEIKEK